MLHRDTLHALDPVRWVFDQFGITLDDWQADVMRSPARRTLLCCSRQSGKSMLAALIGFHEAIFTPSALVAVAAPSMRQDGEVLKTIIGFANRLDPRPRFDEENKLSLAFKNGSRIVCLPSTERTGRGLAKVSTLVIDEAARVEDELVVGLRPMLAVSNGRIIAASTPYGQRGFFWRAWSGEEGDWKRVHITAPMCSRISTAHLDTERESMSARAFAQEYFAEFHDADDCVFSSDAIARAFDPSVQALVSLPSGPFTLTALPRGQA